MTIDECINFLSYRIDSIRQPLVNVSVPLINGISVANGNFAIRRHRLCHMYLPDKDLKQTARIWQVGIFDDTSREGISVFEGSALIEALNKAVEYVKG